MDDVIIKKLQKADLDQIHKLHKSREELDESGAYYRTQKFDWLAFNNPSSGNQATYFAAWIDNKIVAYHGRMPTIFNIDGRKELGYFVHDLFVDPEYRKKGLGFWLAMSLAKEIENQSGSFICLFGMTPLNLMIHRRRNYLELDMPSYIRVLSPDPILKRYSQYSRFNFLLRPILSLYLSIYEFKVRTSRQSKQIKVTESDKFTPEMESLYESLQHNLGISTYKTREILNWKYVDGPKNDNLILVTHSQGKLTGYAVLNTSTNNMNLVTGMVLELIVSPNLKNEVRALMKGALKFFKKRNCDQVKCIMSHNHYHDILKEVGFIKRPGTKLLIGNLEKVDYQERLVVPENWHMTLGEADANMLG